MKKNRFYVFFIVMIIFFNSTFFTYEKAYNVKAASTALYLGYELGTVIMYLISGLAVVGGTWAVMDYLDENSTEEEWEKAYNQEKEIYEKVQGYYQEQDSYANAKVTSADGTTLYLSDFLEEDYMSLEEYKEFKKDTPTPTPDLSGLDWDEVLFSDELLSFFKDFFNEETAKEGVNGQLYYVDDSGYINRETGNVDIYFELRNYYYDEFTYETSFSEFYGNMNDLTSNSSGDFEFYSEYFRVCAVVKQLVSYNSWHYMSNFRQLNQVWTVEFLAFYKNETVERIGVINIPTCIDEQEKNYSSITAGSFGLQFFDYDSGTYIAGAFYEPWGRLLNGNDGRYFPDYLSSNIPLFGIYEDAYNYLSSGCATGCVNIIGDVPSAIDSVCDNLKNKWVNPSGFTTTINNMCNNATDNEITVNNYNEEYITYINEYYSDWEDEYTPTAEPSPTPVPTLPDEDGENTINNYLINIQNIVAPIQTTVNNIYNFFIIDTGKISSAIDLSFKPAANFEPLVTAFDNMIKAFGSDNYVTEETSDSGINLEDQENISGAGGTLIADYPVISVKVPEILDSLLVVDNETICMEDGEKVIILCDFGKYAIYFIRFRSFMIAACWLGMLFYLQKELSVTFNVS